MADTNQAIGREIGGYRVEAELGRGGMGVVYLAFDARLGRHVALKVLPPGFGDDGTFRARFLRESRVAASIDHPNVIPVFEAGDADGDLFIAMRNVEGTDLARLLRAEGALAPRRALMVVGQLASALDAAHASGLVHRDIKPSNALVARADDSDHVYLSDFGLSKEVSTGDATLSAPGVFVGTVRYTAPEVLRGEDADARSDLYSLGCVLFECLTGEPPFAGTSDPAVIYGHLERPPPLASERRPELPGAMDAVVARALAKDPQRRYGSGSELVEAARRALAGEAHRPLPRPRRVHLVVAAALALLVAAAALLLAESGEAPQVADLPGNGVAVIDPADDALTGRLALEGEPAALADGAGAVWVLHSDRDEVARVDKETRTIRQTIGVGHGPAALAVTADNVWVANRDDGSISVISPQTNEVVDTIRVGRTVDGVCSSADDVWVASPLDYAVVRYDPRTARREGAVRIDDQPAGLACGQGSVWVSSPNGGTVTQIDTAGLEVKRTVQLSRGAGPIALGASGVWVTNALYGTLSRIDPDRGVVTAEVSLGATTGPSHLAVTDEAVWVSSEFGAVVSRVDPDRAEVVERLAVGDHPTALAAVDGSLWVGIADAGAQHRGGTLRLEYALGTRRPSEIPSGLRNLSEDGLTGFRRQGSGAVAGLAPNLAEALPVASDGGRTYAFRLRAGLVYSDGRPVLASHVRSGIERGLRTYNAGQLSSIPGAAHCTPRRCDLSSGIVTDDEDRTILIRLETPDPDLLVKLAMPYATVRPPGGDEERPPATGPYRLAEFSRTQVRYERNPRFESWSAIARPDGFPDSIVADLGVRDRAGAVDRVLDDQVDWISSLDVAFPPEEVREAYRVAPAQIRSSVAPLTVFFMFDTTRPPFDALDARLAMSFAMDRRAAVRANGGRLSAVETCQLLPPNFSGYRPYCPFTVPGTGGARGRPHLAEARRLVRRSGTQGMSITLQAPSFVPPGVTGAVARTARRLGYRVAVRRPGPGTHFARMHLPVPDADLPNLGFYPWIADYPAPSTFFDLFSCGPAAPVPAAFCDKRVDRMAARAARLQTVDPAAADEMWARAERRLIDLAPGVAVYNLQNLDLISERVGGYRSVPLLGMLIDQAWVR